MIPLLLVEVGLIAIYFVSNAFSNRENTKAVRELAEAEVSRSAAREAAVIDRRLEGVAHATELLRHDAERVFAPDFVGPRDDPSRFAYSKDGAYYTTRDTGGSAVFYSGFVPVGEREREKAMKSAGLDAAFIGVRGSFPLIVQVYFNAHDSLNRIYPYFDVVSQYAPKMNIPSFSFYYEADAAHDPSRKVVWTDVYVDPAGQGWMTSCVAPVWVGERLEGVVGADVTVDTIVRDVLDLKLPWEGYGLLVGRTGTLIATPKPGERDFGLRDVEPRASEAALEHDRFKSPELNLFAKGRDRALVADLEHQASGMRHADLRGPRIVAWATAPQTGWKLVVAVPEPSVDAPARALAERLSTIAWLMVAGMLAFYAAFFTSLYRRARTMSESISRPLDAIDSMVASIASGEFAPATPDLPVEELQRTALGIAVMAAQLDGARTSRFVAEETLSHRTRQLQSIFDLSPDGFVSIDASGRVVLVNPAFARMTGRAPEGWHGLAEADFWSELGWLAERQLAPPDPTRGPLEIELVHPKRRRLRCEIRDVRDDAAAASSRVVYLHDFSREADLDRMKSEFLATAAHELRTPLTSVLGYAELLLLGRVPEAMRAEALGTIVTQSKWLVTMIGELLDLARIEARGGLDFEIGAVALGDVVAAAVSGVKTPKGRAGVTLLPSPRVVVDADESKARQVVMNVIDNAYRYSQSGDVAVEVLAGVEGMGGVRVVDHGIGMSDEQVSHVFDRFWRGDTSGKVPGTGLGMSIAREIVTALHGRIEVTSELGVGTTVTIWLPLARGAAAS